MTQTPSQPGAGGCSKKQTGWLLPNTAMIHAMSKTARAAGFVFIRSKGAAEAPV